MDEWGKVAVARDFSPHMKSVPGLKVRITIKENLLAVKPYYFRDPASGCQLDTRRLSIPSSKVSFV